MTTRVKHLIESLELSPHPEGGFYKETYRSSTNFGDNRQLATSIYFLLTADNPSKFHRILSDELWFFHEGSSLNIHLLNNQGHSKLKLGLNIENGEKPYHLVEANTIFGSSIDEDSEGYALVSCVVAPGFSFDEFKLFSQNELLELHPDCEDIIQKLS